MSDIYEQIRQASTRNSDLLRTLAETDYATPAMEQQVIFLRELKAELQQSNEQLKKLNFSRIKEQGEHERYRDSNVTRFMWKATGQGKKFEKRAAKEEREYFEVMQQIQEANSVNNNLSGQVAEAEKALAELERVISVHKDAQQQLDSLYLSIFSGPTPQFPGEDEREQKEAVALQQYHDTRMKFEAETYALGLLEEAKRSHKNAFAQLEEALQSSRMDMMGGGTMFDMMERAAVSQAQRCVHEAEMVVMRAKQSSPHIIELPRLSFNQGSIMSDVFFDNIFTDMAYHDELKRMREELRAVNKNLEAQAVGAKNRKQQLGFELKQREDDLLQARQALQKFRSEAFESVAKGKASY